MFNQLAYTEYDRARVQTKLEALPFAFRRTISNRTDKAAEKRTLRQVSNELRCDIGNTKKAIAAALERLDISFKPWEIRTKEDARKTAAAKAQAVYAGIIALADHATGDYSQKLDYVYRETVGNIAAVHPEIVTPPAETDEEKECAILRMRCEKWWDRKLQKIRRRSREYMAITKMEVGAKSAYASRESVAEWVRDQMAITLWAGSNEMVNSRGECIEMQKAIASGMANPENMRVELMKRIAGLEDYAEEIGSAGAFVTLTAPSAYHRCKGSTVNPKWNGSTPKETQAYMVATWAKVRAKLDRLELSYFGVRVAEPHRDGTPHWHMLLWAEPKQLRVIKKVIFQYFCEADKAELLDRWHNRHLKNKRYFIERDGLATVAVKVYPDFKRAFAIWRKDKAKGKDRQKPKIKDLLPWAPRFVWVDIESTPKDEDTFDHCLIADRSLVKGKKGRRKKSAAGYIAKYISKNINAAGVEGMICAETGKVIDKTIAHVKAWASLWGIRQFQFQGTEPITVYRELRRVRDKLACKLLDKVREAAESDSFVDFIKAMKGIDCGLQYDVEPYGNDYGEAVKRVKGVGTGSFVAVTRAESWTIRRKAAALRGAAARSWTSGNNCTAQPLGPKFATLGIDAEAMAHMERGCTVKIGAERWRIGRYGQVEPAPAIKYSKPWNPAKPDFTTTAH